MNVRVRGIYSTALTAILADHEELSVVQPSEAIDDRFGTSFPLAPADATIETTTDRQGVGIVGTDDAVTATADLLTELGKDVFVWTDPTPRDAVFNGRVTETLGSGAVVDLGVGDRTGASNSTGTAEGWLPFGNSDDHIADGDCLRVQVREPVAPWASDRPRLDTAIELPGPGSGSLARLVRGGRPQGGTGAANMVDLIPTDPRDGWAVRWGRLADDAAFDALAAALDASNGRAAALDDALMSAPDPSEETPARIWAGTATKWCWFGRDARFEFDEYRSTAVPTMPGHHRIKAGSNSAGAAVDFVEAVCGADATIDGDLDMPFGVVARQFGPQRGDEITIGHGKPDGRLIQLGTGEIIEWSTDGKITLRREMSPGGTYDALGTDREAGDVAITKFKEGRWWYPTVYRDNDNNRKGTYVNICTPVEIFPESVRYVDLHVDVIKHADGRVERVDDDELDAAVDDGNIPDDLAEKARTVASAVQDAL